MNTHVQSQNLNFEKVWQMFQETDKKFQETDKKFQETDKKFQETANGIQETKQLVKETTLAQKETEWLLKDLGKLHGGLSNNIGESVEEFFYYGFEKKRKIGKIRFKKIVRNMRTDKAEYDLVLTNGEYVAILEVKHKFNSAALVKFLTKKLPDFKKEFPKFAECKIIAAIAGFVIPKETKNAALEAGLYIFTQSGENIKALNPRKFVPRLY